MQNEFPYNLPIWRRKYSKISPDNKIIAEINPTYEVSMGNPTYGTLILSNGINIDLCNPSFIWSDNSRYIAVPQFTKSWLFRIGKQRLLVIDAVKNEGYKTKKIAYYIQPEKFESNILTITVNPFSSVKTVTYDLLDKSIFSKLTKMADRFSLQPIG